MASLSKLLAQAVPTPSSPAGGVLFRSIFTAASLSLISDCFARSISHVIHLLVWLFEPTMTNRYSADFIIVVKDALTLPASTLSIASWGDRLSNSNFKFELASHAARRFL